MRIVKVERLGTSAHSNPQYAVWFSDGTSAKTVPDGQVGYLIGNPEYRENEVHVSFQGGYIIGVEVVDE